MPFISLRDADMNGSLSVPRWNNAADIVADKPAKSHRESIIDRPVNASVGIGPHLDL